MYKIIKTPKENIYDVILEDTMEVIADKVNLSGFTQVEIEEIPDIMQKIIIQSPKISKKILLHKTIKYLIDLREDINDYNNDILDTFNDLEYILMPPLLLDPDQDPSGLFNKETIYINNFINPDNEYIEAMQYNGFKEILFTFKHNTKTDVIETNIHYFDKGIQYCDSRKGDLRKELESADDIIEALDIFYNTDISNITPRIYNYYGRLVFEGFDDDELRVVDFLPESIEKAFKLYEM